MSCAKTDEPIEMPFGVWTRVGPRKVCKLGTPEESATLGRPSAMRPFVEIL